MSTIEVGNISESLVLGAYIKEGFDVSVPFGNGCPYDLIVDTGTQLIKVQVKTGWQSKGRLLYKYLRRVKDSTQNCMRRYREGEVDFFAIYFPITDSIYVVPLAEVSGYGCLRISPTLNGQRKLIRWAADYTWESHIENLKREKLSFERVDVGANHKKAARPSLESNRKRRFEI